MGRLESRILKQLIRGFLIADSSVSGLVADRVFGSHLSDSDLQTLIYPMIVFDFLSGSAAWTGAVQAQTLELYGYSKESGDEAGEVYDAVFDIMHHERIALSNVTTRALIFEIQRPIDGFNEATKAWFVRGRWQVSST